MNKYIPNLLTLLRLIAIPFFVILSLGNRSIAALFVFVFACITDYFDGMIARKYNVISNFGKLMDPLADKTLVLAALVLLAIPTISYIHWSVVLIIAFREIAVSVLRQRYLKKNIVIAANIWGKIKTVVQMTGIITALVLFAAFKMNIFEFLMPYQNGLIFSIRCYFWITALITMLSGMNYFMVKAEELNPHLTQKKKNE